MHAAVLVANELDSLEYICQLEKTHSLGLHKVPDEGSSLICVDCRTHPYM